jgi:Icc-related predicted phosphoesterase
MSAMRLLVTADLHYNHAKSRNLADELIDQMNPIDCDALLVVGDTAAFDGTELEACLSKFSFGGPKLFVAGNHELWTRGLDSYHNFRIELPRRIHAIGWHWLQDVPFVNNDLAIVGSVGWYDYSFAPASLAIPRRFYEAKISPGAAEYFTQFQHLLKSVADVSAHAKQVVARWNDGKFVHLHRSDEQFLDELLAQLRTQLDALKNMKQIIAAVHHLPFEQLLPPPHSAQWDFAKAYLGSGRIGELLLGYTNVKTVVCGHSHFPAEAMVGHIHAINIGSGYRQKRFRVIELL